MLKNTFLHIPKHKSKERTLWKKGFISWDDLIKKDYGNSLIVGNHPIWYIESEKAYAAGDVEYFAGLLPTTEQYRIAMSFPNDVMFLDIETTGLSHWYHQVTLIGWSIGNKYEVFVANRDGPNSFAEALYGAKALVTYNGKRFDVKFIKGSFPDFQLPKIHIDLCFLGRRVGLTGGQKAIEKEIGFTRQTEIEDGGEAVALWHEYRRGDKNALKELIIYNHADIEGMKAIFDSCIQRLISDGSIPESSCAGKKKLFSAMSSSISSDDFPFSLSPMNVGPEPQIDYERLNALQPLEELLVIGIDPVSDENRASGVALLKGKKVSTFQIKTDADIIQFVNQHKPAIVSVDSPLSIPAGRTSVFDDDPMREYGIMRYCERELKKRGVNVYPCLIPSMQKLTKRCMELADKIRQLGVAVIESFPGAAQDIMGIARKQSGLNLLISGLREYGIQGQLDDVSHDELDAVTSAIVGHFFWAGKFEALGTADEAPLIIPDLNTESKWANKSVIGFSGPIGAGKTTAAHYLRDHLDYEYTRYSLVLKHLLIEKGEEPTRSALQEIGLSVHKNEGQYWLSKKLLEHLKSDSKIVIDGLRFPEDVAFWREMCGPAFLHCYIDCTEQERAARIQKASGEDLPLSRSSSHEVESAVNNLRGLADIVVDNNSSV